VVGKGASDGIRANGRPDRTLVRARLEAVLALALSVFAGLTLATASASALATHRFVSGFGSPGQGAGELALTGGTEEAAGSGVAVNSTTHDVYVADTGNARVDEFTAAGTFVRAWGWGVADGLPTSETCALSCSAGLQGSQPGQFTAPAFIAVDNSGGLSSGDVYVGDATTHLVQKFTASGVLVNTWGSGGQLDGSTATDGPFGPLAGIAVDAGGSLFALGNPSGWVMFQFAQDSSFTTDFETRFGTAPAGIALDSSGNIYKVRVGGTVVKFDSTGNVIGTVTGERDDTGLAVDPSTSDIYVDEGGSIEHFAASCEPAEAECAVADTFGASHVSGGAGLAADGSNHTVYAADSGNQRVDVFTPAVLADVTTGQASNAQQTTATLNGTVNPGGIAVTDCHFDYVTDAAFQANGYAGAATAACSPPPGSGSSDVTVSADISGLAPGTTYRFRVTATTASGENQGGDQTFETTPAVKSVTTGAVSNVQGTSATLNGTLDPNSIDTTYHFQYIDDAGFQAGGYTGATTAPVPDGDAGATAGEQAVHTDISQLQPATTYHFRLVATNIIGTTFGQGQAFQTPPPPSIDGTSSENVEPTSVDLLAKINPNGADTFYRFEYGTSTSYGASAPVPDADLGAATNDQNVIQHLSGLVANTTYHFRVIARSSAGTATGQDHTFVFEGGAPAGPDGCPNAAFRVGLSALLPDCRSYELVTPPFKQGALPVLMAVSPDGSRAIVRSLGNFGEVGNNADLAGATYGLTRTSSGWSQANLDPPASQFPYDRYLDASPDLGKTLWYMRATAQSRNAFDVFIRDADGALHDLGPVAPPSSANAPPGPGLPLRQGEEGTTYRGASTDLSHVLISLTSPGGNAAGETSFLWPGDTTAPGKFDSLYEYNVGRGGPPALVGVDNAGHQLGQCGIRPGAARNDGGPGIHAVSGDGSVVFFSVTGADDDPRACNGAQPPVDELFARVSGSRTVAISDAAPGADCTSTTCRSAALRDANFERASTDGSKVFFTSTQQLTDAASQDNTQTDSASRCSQTSGPSGCNLYLYDFNSAGGHELVLASRGDPKPRVQGVVAASDDGSHIFFVAQGVLTAAPNQAGVAASDGADNLYIFERDARFPTGHTSFIATLTPNDSEQWTDLAGSRASTTPDGHFLAFTSSADLTGDDISTAPQVFRYDAQTGQLARVSIGRNGFNDNGNTSALAAAMPFQDLTHLARSDLAMSNDGAHIAFTSANGLTPTALNAHRTDTAGTLAQNVYDYHNGNVQLISDGQDATTTSGSSSVVLLGVSASGGDIFFQTANRLAPQDADTQLDFYTARSGGGFPGPPDLSTACSGDGCQGPFSGTPADQASGSSTFVGAGTPATGLSVSHPPPLTRAQKLANALKACSKKPKRQRARCRAQAHKKYGTPSKAKHSNQRGASRAGVR
jgi:hypothetical protein